MTRTRARTPCNIDATRTFLRVEVNVLRRVLVTIVLRRVCFIGLRGVSYVTSNAERNAVRRRNVPV